jgi:LysM repeat protein
MNTPNPLMPQGSMKELNKGKSHVRIAVFTILAIHVVVISGLLIAGCKKDSETAQNTTTNSAPALVPPPDIIPTPSNDVVTAPPAATANPSLISPPPTHEPPVAPAGTTEYTVAKGDSFSTIATKLGVPLKALIAANPNVDPKKLRPEQKIQVPPKTSPIASAAPSPPSAFSTDGTYVVKPGDNLTTIAKAHGTTVKALRAANNLKTDQIRVNQRLKLPVKAAAGATASAEPIPTGAGAP